jgi:cyclic-di-GMP-binding protein
MPSFDITCEIDMQEMDNAVNQAIKEISTRFDFRSGKSTIELDRNEKIIKITADDEMKLRSIHQILETKMAKRGLDCRALDYGDTETASGNLLRQKVKLRCGLDKEEAKKISKLIKDTGLKVQAQIQDEQVRVTAKKIDDLQEVIAALRASSLGLPLKFTNMRS